MTNQATADIIQVKKLIESRTKFLSLSGMSGILAGLYALVGAYLAYQTIYKSNEIIYYDLLELNFSIGVIKLILIASVVFVAALLTSYFLSKKKARENGEMLFSKAAYRMGFSFCIPLFAGAIFILILLVRKDIDLIAPSSLLFYGLALFNASNYTYKDVSFLGIAFIILSLTNMIFIGYGLWFWAIGFGVFHVLYGVRMYYKYERKHFYNTRH